VGNDFHLPVGNRLVRSLKRLGQTHYPGFIFGLPLEKGKVPVFVYHDIDREEFRADLAFLQENGYRTLGVDEFCQRNKREEEKAVLLTFDDARSNFFKIAFPLLCEFKSQATLFVSTNWISSRTEGEIIKKVETGEVPSGDLFMTWGEIRACARSGLVDVQSHSHRHALVYRSPRVVDFVSPSTLRKYDIFDWPMRCEGGIERLGYPPLGTPIYEAIPLLSAMSRFREDPSVDFACQEFVRSQGGERYFSKWDWLNGLERTHGQASRSSRGGQSMGEDDIKSLVVSEFKQSDQLFKDKLGESPKYLAYPWMLGSGFSILTAAEFGIKAVFGTGIDFRRARRMRAPVSIFGRTKGEWLRFLPGRGRRHLYQVIPGKVKRFARTQHLAH
jgi:hypothetical protein